MKRNTTISDNRGITAEVGLIVRRGRQVWSLIPRRYKLALGGAALIMAIISAGNTVVALLLGHLVDCIKVGLEEHWTQAVIYRGAGWVLGLLALIYLGA